jgi:hypothetical protein
MTIAVKLQNSGGYNLEPDPVAFPYPPMVGHKIQMVGGATYVVQDATWRLSRYEGEEPTLYLTMDQV